MLQKIQGDAEKVRKFHATRGYIRRILDPEIVEDKPPEFDSAYVLDACEQVLYFSVSSAVRFSKLKGQGPPRPKYSAEERRLFEAAPRSCPNSAGFRSTRYFIHALMQQSDGAELVPKEFDPRFLLNAEEWRRVRKNERDLSELFYAESEALGEVEWEPDERVALEKLGGDVQQLIRFRATRKFVRDLTKDPKSEPKVYDWRFLLTSREKVLATAAASSWKAAEFFFPSGKKAQGL